MASSNDVQARKLDERWESTSIHATFTLEQLPSRTTRSRSIPIYLPLLSLGSFALSLAPERRSKKKFGGKGLSCNWVPATFSFHQRDSGIPWGDTSMHAELSLDTEQDNHVGDSIFGQPLYKVNSSTLLGSIVAVLAHTPSTELPLAISLTLSSHQPIKLSLTVTFSDCPFPGGLFQATSKHGSETEAQTQLAKLIGNRVLARSLATGKLFDVKFLSASARLVSGNTGVCFPTYASLAVLEKCLYLPGSKLRNGWTNALAGLDVHGNPDTNFKEVSSPAEYEYELDSDYDDEEQSPSAVEPCKDNLAIVLQGEQRESSTARSSSLWTDRGSAQGPVNSQLEEVILESGGPSHLFPGAAACSEPAIFIKFAAHRTWQAFVWYCYTGHVEFNKLKSQVESGTRHRCVAGGEDGPPSCSPKSMYRLADLIGDNDLKALALKAIGDRTTKTNVLDEALSVFTSKYPDVREVQLDVLMEHCESPEVKKAFLKAMRKYSNMPHAEPVLSAFYDRLVA